MTLPMRGGALFRDGFFRGVLLALAAEVRTGCLVIQV